MKISILTNFTNRKINMHRSWSLFNSSLITCVDCFTGLWQAGLCCWYPSSFQFTTSSWNSGWPYGSPNKPLWNPSRAICSHDASLADSPSFTSSGQSTYLVEILFVSILNCRKMMTVSLWMNFFNQCYSIPCIEDIQCFMYQWISLYMLKHAAHILPQE